jgi:membrane peptidoglycan carboxypeptidase
LTTAYASFARGGRSLDATFFEPATAQGGGRRVMSKASAFLVSDVLADNDARTPAFGRNSALHFSFPVAAKTGTSQNFHDNWVIGFTANITVGVWVGNFDRTPLAGATGVTGAGPLFHAVMLAAHSRLSPRAPGSLGDATFNALVPDELVASSGGSRTEYRWRGNRTSSATVTASQSGGRLQLIEPVNGGAYLIDETRPRDTQRLPLRASGGRGPYLFFIDDLPETNGAWLLQNGKHRACVRDSSAGYVCHSFTVA